MKNEPLSEITEIVSRLARNEGYSATALPGLRLLRSERNLRDVPVLYRPGAVFVCQGSKRGLLGDDVYVYDQHRYLAVSVPVPFRMESDASPQTPLLAVYLDFDLSMAAGLADEMERLRPAIPQSPKGLASTPVEPVVADVLLRLLRALCDPLDTEILGPSLLRELHYRILTGAQGSAMIAALRQRGTFGKISRSLRYLHARRDQPITIGELALEAGMSVPSYHTHFRAVTGSTPLQYLKSLRLHEARLLLARDGATIGAAAGAVGYASTSQFSREFKRHFGRTASQEIMWMRRHLGELYRETTETARMPPDRS